QLFAQRYDAIVTPAAAGTAPEGLGSTGDPAFCTLWTLCGMPALSVPLMEGANGLPLGVQLVGPRHGDARLLRTARWLVTHVASMWDGGAVGVCRSASSAGRAAGGGSRLARARRRW